MTTPAITALVLVAAVGTGCGSPQTSPLASSPRTFDVSATRGWQDTGVTISAGQPFQINHLSGRITDERTEIADAGGSDYVCGHPGCCEPLPASRRSALVGKIGDEPFFVGSGASFTPAASGRLFLRINDCDDGLYDNGGFLTVQIRSEPGARQGERP